MLPCRAAVMDVPWGRGLGGSSPSRLRRSHAATGFLDGVPDREARVITEVLESRQSSWGRDINRGQQKEERFV